MPGVTPNEGRNAVARILYQREARDANLVIGLWAGTWDGELTRTFAAVDDAVLTKITAAGLEEKVLTDATWAVLVGAASYAEQIFTNASGGTVAVNGYYIALTIGAVKTFLHIERDAAVTNVANGSDYAATPSNTVA